MVEGESKRLKRGFVGVKAGCPWLEEEEDDDSTLIYSGLEYVLGDITPLLTLLLEVLDSGYGAGEFWNEGDGLYK